MISKKKKEVFYIIFLFLFSTTFNQYYGFMNGAPNHFYPELFRDNHAVEPPKKPEETPKNVPNAIANNIEANPTINDILDP